MLNIIFVVPPPEQNLKHPPKMTTQELRKMTFPTLGLSFAPSICCK